MNIRTGAFLFVLQIFGLTILAQCPPGQNEIKLEINSDVDFYEVQWTIKDNVTGVVHEMGELPDDDQHEYTYCIPDDGCKEFRITDSYGDGMAGGGYYRLYLNGVLLHENIGGQYLFGESVYFGCPPGTTCASGLPVTLGNWETPDGAQIWYRFVPQDTGIYQINTCDSLNACGSKIWVYSSCQNLVVTDDQTGADFYAEGGCANGAEASLYLAGGEDYYIRIRYEPDNCDTTPIHFSLSYLGPIIGCMDPIACNYEPLATISDTCIYPGDPNCDHAPDLVTNEDEFRSSMYLETIDNPDPCMLTEGCIRGLGQRHLINFTTFITNIGDLDYHIGPVPSDTSEASSQFIWDPCHHHWHYIGYAEYVLFDANGYRLPIGTKAGFCVLDLLCGIGGTPKYNCSNMGLSVGCTDVYQIGTPCQWIDITDIPAGDYTMVLRVNWDKSPDAIGRLEKDYDNNWAQACFTLSYAGTIPEVEYHNEQCQPYTDCAGEVFGDAQPDCNGVCNGPSLHGDINQDSMRNTSDTQEYLEAALNDDTSASPCLDLDGNGNINIYDAALLQECIIHQNAPPYWIQRIPCQFPTGFNNTQDLVVLKPGAVDTVAKTFDIEIVNPFNKILGYEFSVSGLVISSLENLATAYNPDLRFNAATGKIIGLGLDESVINKHPMPTQFLRVHYSALTGTEVCIENITAVVNSKYQLSNASLANPNCVMVQTSGIAVQYKPAFRVYVQPNPFIEKTTIYFDNEGADPMEITIKDFTGKTIRFFEGIRNNSVTIERKNLPQGAYIFTVRGTKGTVSGKIIAQ